MRNSRFRRFALSSLALAAAVGLAVFVACQAAPPVESASDCIPFDKTVTFSTKGDQIVAQPLVAVVRPGETLTFVADDLGDRVLEIDFKVEGQRKGPFREFAKDRPRGRFTLSREAAKATATYDKEVGDGVWKYEVVLRDREGRDLAAIDPMAVGKGGM